MIEKVSEHTECRATAGRSERAWAGRAAAGPELLGLDAGRRLATRRELDETGPGSGVAGTDDLT